MRRGAPILIGLLLALGASVPGAAAEGTWTTYLYANDVRDLVVTEEGVWAATTGGALAYDFALGRLRAWSRAAGGPASDTLTAVAALGSGEIAFGTTAQGISLYDPASGSWVTYTALTWPLAGDAIRFIGEDPPWRILGSRGGFVALREGEVREACQAGLDICGLPGWEVTAGIDHGGALWFGTRPGEGSLGGIGRLDYAASGTWDTLNVGLPSLDVLAFAVAGESLYCATGAGVCVWTGASWGDRSTGLASGVILTDLAVAPDGLLLAATGAEGGVFRRAPGAAAWQRLGERAFHASCVAVGPAGEIWAGASPEDTGEVWLTSEEDGLWERVGEEWVQHRLPGPHPVATYKALTVDGAGRLWAATAAPWPAGWRLERLAQGSWSFFDQADPGLSNAWVHELRAEGNRLWIGHCCCPRADLSCFLEAWDLETGEIAVLDSVYNVYDSARDAWGNLWFASWVEGTAPTAMGLYRRAADSGETTRHSLESTGGELRDDRITAVVAEGEYLWIGYPDDGLSRVHLDAGGALGTAPGDWVHYSADDAGSPLPSNGVRALAAGPGEVWVGTTNGVTRWQEGTWRIFYPSPWGLPGNEVTDVALTEDGAAWVAIRGYGVTRVAPDPLGGYTFESFGPPELVNPDPIALAVGSSGRDLWVGTQAGLSHFEPGGALASTPLDELRVFPNPYNPLCGEPLRLIELSGQARDGVIADVSGRIVARFSEVWDREAIWDGRTADGTPVAPGLYVIRAATPVGRLTGHVAVLDLPCE